MDVGAGIFGWIYVSESLLSPADEDTQIAEIVKISRSRNADFEVTGALLFSGGRFAQLIEGPVEGVTALRHSIEADTRHHMVTTIEFASKREREFQACDVTPCFSSNLD